MVRHASDTDKALGKLGTGHGNRNWNHAGCFDVPGQVMRDLVTKGHAQSRKLHAFAPAEYRGTYIGCANRGTNGTG